MSLSGVLELYTTLYGSHYHNPQSQLLPPPMRNGSRICDMEKAVFRWRACAAGKCSRNILTGVQYESTALAHIHYNKYMYGSGKRTFLWGAPIPAEGEGEKRGGGCGCVEADRAGKSCC